MCMWEWVHAHHDDLQALGPVATLLASAFAAGAAIFIGLRLQGLQASIAASQIDVAKAAKEVAESQRDIAMDKLKLDLFNKRYAIYAEALDIAYDSIAYFDGRKSNITTDRLNKLQEARFVFSPEAVTCIENISHAAREFKTFFDRLTEMSKDGSGNTDHQDQLVTSAMSRLMDSAGKLQAAVLQDMSFQHLKPRA